MSEWKKVKLKDCCIKIGSGSTPKGGSMVYVNSGTSLIRSQNVYNLSFDYNGLTHITEDAANKLKGVTVFNEDILLNITGDSVARTCIVPKGVLPARVNQHVAIIRTDRKKMNWRFLNYYLASPKMQAHMLSLAVGKGASRNAMTKQMIENFEVPYPPLSTQHRIATILSRYDSLIENYQKQITLLEEAAQRLYKEWFINLHFPGHENTNIIDGVPEGWEKKNVNSIIELQSGFAFKSSTFDDNGTYKIVTIKNVKDGAFDGDNVSKIVAIPDKMPKHCILADGDILLSLTGNVGRVCIVKGKSYLLNQRVAKLATDYKAFTYCLFRSRDMFIEVNNLANGAAQQNVSPIRIGEMKILLPNSELLQEFESIVFKSVARIISLQSQLHLLTEARDRLLPKLMSGEIEI